MNVRRILWPAIRAAFGAAGIAFLVIALRRALDRSEGGLTPSWGAALAAGAFLLAGLWLAGGSWVALFEGGAEARALRRGFFASQLGKYIPGAIWQAVALVDSGRRAGVALPRAGASFPVHAAVQVAAGGTVGAGLAVAGSGLGAAPRLLSLLGLATLFLLDRRWMVRLFGVLGRIARRTVPADAVPAQGAILRSFAWSLGTLLASGAAFAVLLASVGGGARGAVYAFSLSWTVGFLALPFPSGLGVREAVLIATVPLAGTGAVLSASIAHRVGTMAAEVVMIAASRIRR